MQRCKGHNYGLCDLSHIQQTDTLHKHTQASWQAFQKLRKSKDTNKRHINIKWCLLDHMKLRVQKHWRWTVVSTFQTGGGQGRVLWRRWIINPRTAFMWADCARLFQTSELATRQLNSKQSVARSVFCSAPVFQEKLLYLPQKPSKHNNTQPRRGCESLTRQNDRAPIWCQCEHWGRIHTRCIFKILSGYMESSL